MMETTEQSWNAYSGKGEQEEQLQKKDRHVTEGAHMLFTEEERHAYDSCKHQTLRGRGGLLTG